MFRDLLFFIWEVMVPVVFFAACAVAAVAVPLYLLGDRKVPEIDAGAPAYLASLGFDVVGREGFTYGLFSQPGGCVWFTMARKEQPTTIYTGCVSRWHNGTYELWNQKAINAVSAH